MKSRFYRNLIYKTLFFFLVWLLLSESFDRFHMGLGLLSAFGVAWLNTDRHPTRAAIPPLRVMRYIPWLMLQVIQSGIHLSYLILHPSLPIEPKLFRYKTKLMEDAGIVLLANSITLTPGTITLEINGQELVIHAIDETAVSDITNDQFEHRIASMLIEPEGRA